MEEHIGELSGPGWASPDQIPTWETFPCPQEHLSCNGDVWAATMSLLHSQGRKHTAQPQHCQNTFILCPDHPLGSVSLLQHPRTRVVHMGQAQRVAFGAGGVQFCF